MGQVIPFPLKPRHPEHEFTIVLARITLNSKTQYMVRVLRGDTKVTDDIYFDNEIDAAMSALKDAKTMSTIHRQAIGIDNRVTAFKSEIRA